MFHVWMAVTNLNESQHAIDQMAKLVCRGEETATQQGKSYRTKIRRTRVTLIVGLLTFLDPKYQTY